MTHNNEWKKANSKKIEIYLLLYFEKNTVIIQILKTNKTTIFFK